MKKFKGRWRSFDYLTIC